MSDAEEDYESEVSNESEPDEPVTKKSKSIDKKVGLPGVDDDSDASSVATEDDAEDEPNLLNSDADDDSDIGDVDEDALFAADTSKKNKNAENAGADDGDEEYKFGFDSDADDESDLDDDDGEQYLQKLDDSVRQQTIANHHPELIINNYEEVEALTTVIRDKRGVIVDPLHKTLPFLTKYEKTRILGERAKQINDGAKSFVDTDPSVIDGYLIALAELEQKKIPFIIRRPLSNGGSEYWKLKDLEIIL